jgi:uncharacterized protein YbjT (DUF2867 family)
MTTKSNKTNDITLVLGSSGKTGRRVAARLQQQGRKVRAGSRSGTPPFDWTNETTWGAALEGVQSAYVTYYSDLAFPGAADAVRSFAKAAVESGVRKLVLLSGRGEEGAQRGEQAIRDSGADWTVIRASWFHQNFSENFLLEAVLGGEVAFPAGNVGEPFIDVDDIADIAAAALTDDRHAGQLYEVTGPRLLTFADAVAEIAKATGRDIRYVPVLPGQYASALLEQGLPADLVNPLVELIATVLDGRNTTLADGVQRALGRPPRDFADYARDTAATGIWTPALPAQAR